MIPKFTFRTQTIATPQMVLASHLLALSTTDLEHTLQSEVASNPALALAISDDPNWPDEPLSPLESGQAIDSSLGEDRARDFDASRWWASARDQLVAQARLLVAADDLDLVT